MSGRRASVVLVALVASVIVVALLVVRRDGPPHTTSVGVPLASTTNGLPGLVTVERVDARRITVRPEWPAWSTSTGRAGVSLIVQIGGASAVIVRAWLAPGQPGWAVVAGASGGRGVAVQSLGLRRMADIMRPKGWDITWRDGASISNGDALTVRVAEASRARPWDPESSLAADAVQDTFIGVCDAPSSPRCERMPAPKTRR